MCLTAVALWTLDLGCYRAFLLLSRWLQRHEHIDGSALRMLVHRRIVPLLVYNKLTDASRAIDAVPDCKRLCSQQEIAIVRSEVLVLLVQQHRLPSHGARRMVWDRLLPLLLAPPSTTHAADGGSKRACGPSLSF